MEMFPQDVMAVPLERFIEGRKAEVRVVFAGCTHVFTGETTGHTDALVELLEHKARVLLAREMGHPVSQIDSSGTRRKARKMKDGKYEVLQGPPFRA